VSLSSSNAAAASVPATVTIPQGSTSATFSVTAGGVTAMNWVVLTVSYMGVNQTFGVVNPQQLVINSISSLPSTMDSGQSATGTVSLNGAAGVSGVVVSLSSSNVAIASVPATAILPPGYVSITFPVTAGTVTAASPVTLTASYAGVSQQLTVSP
jgi:hypothetical protein